MLELIRAEYLVLFLIGILVIWYVMAQDYTPPEVRERRRQIRSLHRRRRQDAREHARRLRRLRREGITVKWRDK